MSEQTPDTNSDVSDGQDPSMEDILASIRKIIAEDDVQLEVSDELGAIVAAGALKGDVSNLAQADSLDLDIIEDVSATMEAEPLELATEAAPMELTADSEIADIDALIGDMDARGVEGNAMSAPDMVSEALPESEVDDVLDLMIPMEDSDLPISNLAIDELAFDETTELTVETEEIAADTVELFDEAEALTAPSAEPPEDDLALMLDNMLEDSAPEDDVEALQDIDLLEVESDTVALEAENLLADETVSEPAPEEHIEEDHIEEEHSFDSGEDLLDELDMSLEDDVSAEVQETDPDIKLVKSLMADLTEVPLHEEDAFSAIDEASVDEIDSLLSDIDDESDTSGDVMDELLSLTLNDEAALSEELEIPEMSVDADIAEPSFEAAPDVGLSLKDIAAQAMADAGDADPSLIAGAAALTGLGAAGVAISAAQDDEVEPETDDVEDILTNFDDALSPVEAEHEAELEDITDLMPEEPVHITPEPITEETPPMARAKKKEAIIDDVTEEATAGAFASLNQVVEQKATVAERGDRIGDLVQEALRPMLKEWLDANLKGIVERAVTKEVKRISSGK